MATTVQTGAAVRPVERHGNSKVTEGIYRYLLYGAVVLGGIVFAIPFYWMLRTSVMPTTQVYLFPPEWWPERFEWHHFKTPFAVFPFAKFFVNSTFIATGSAIGAALSASVVGFSFARLRFPLRDIMFVVVLATMILPEHVRLVPTYLLFVQLDWIGTYRPLIIPNWFAPAFYVFLMRQFFMTIPRELDDSAMIDGCNPIGLFWRIHMPLSLPALGVVIIFMVTNQWNDFLYPLIYIQGVPNYTVALGLRLFEGHMTNNMQALMAASILGVMPTIILFFFAQRHFVQGIVISGVKG
ncbi:MAG: carbohydrate ABC transporter permease [Caldilineaceae bacterium]|nr:carbohydrate ABC transporter permease [Caldilineaceae bacterium]MCY3991471.1 carbohydrate ABC transporter permease [Caldilineaceae bacterium]MDE0077108.1 carbohydrate ABC transporter permease [Caldilineaceae bacterium]MDE0312088.1 carbohydrate ABC transporter permease [Caldilineaceae bacterium]